MKIFIYLSTFTLGLSSLAHANNPHSLNGAETMAHLVNIQKGSGFQSICSYRSVTQHYGIHELRASMYNGCPQNMAYIATSAEGGILRVLGTTNHLSVKRLGYRPPAKSSQAVPAVVSKYKRLCDNPNMSVSFNTKTGETTDCRTGEVTIDPQIKALKEQGLWPH